LVAKIVKS